MENISCVHGKEANEEGIVSCDVCNGLSPNIPGLRIGDKFDPKVFESWQPTEEDLEKLQNSIQSTEKEE